MGEGQGPTGINRENILFDKSKTGTEGGGKAKGTLRKEDLASWLIEPKEYKSLKAGLKPLVELIGGREEESNTPERLEKDIDRLEGLVENGQVKAADIAPYRQRIQTKIVEVGTRAQIAMALTTSPEMFPTDLSPEVVWRLIEKDLGPLDTPPDLGDDTMEDREEMSRKVQRAKNRLRWASGAANSPGLAEAMGILPPEKQLDIVYRSIERRGQIPMNVAQPLSFEVMFDSDSHPEMPPNEAATQHENFRIRFSNLMSGAAQKAVAGSVDSVMNPIPEAEKRLDPMGVEFKKADLEFLFTNQPGSLEATSIWTTIVAGPEYVGPNPPDIREKLLNFFLKDYKTNKDLEREKEKYVKALEKLGFNPTEIENLLDSTLINYRKRITHEYDKTKGEEKRFMVIPENPKDPKAPKKFLGKDFAHELQYIGHLKDLGFSNEEVKSLLRQRQKLLEGRYGCTPSFWAADEPNFERIRDSVQYWLKTEGRDNLYIRRMVPTKDRNGKKFRLENREDWERAQEYIKQLRALGLPSDEIRQHLKEERLSKQLSLKELEGLAKDAEQPAWNFVFTVGLVESFNTEEACWWLRHMANNVKGPSNHMTLYLWMGLHPVQRWTAKIMTGAKLVKNDEGEEILKFNLKENWSSFGVWGTNNIAQMSQDPSRGMKNDRTKQWTLYRKIYAGPEGNLGRRLVLVTPKFLRPDLVKDGFRQEEDNKEAFFDSFTEIGSKILNNPREFVNNDAVCKNLFDRKSWKSLNTTPFVNYRFDHLRWGLTAYTVFKKGTNSERDVVEDDMQEAFYRLDLSLEERVALLVARVGINNVKLNTLSSTGGKLGFALYLRELQNSKEYGLKNLFKNQEIGKPVETTFDWTGYPKEDDDETKTIIEEWKKSRIKVDWR